MIAHAANAREQDEEEERSLDVNTAWAVHRVEFRSRSPYNHVCIY